MKFYLRATGDEVVTYSALASKIGSLGLAPKKVGENIAKTTVNWKAIIIIPETPDKN
ncbi:12979_t:CDS:2 [Ambispora leptoticha]|uniref:12979_t:CDS:1 n=1 Tax=Ambispora leptoticha TaxID=144679 RepID=A0A9N9BIR2_9GLOM|nr:12979_t:CDS:2 [Ambispora leptoticha]